MPPATTTSPGRTKPKGVARALDKLNPGDASSFPLPLLILGALAILLVAAGVVGMIWRRMDRGDTDAGAGPRSGQTIGLHRPYREQIARERDSVRRDGPWAS